MSHRRRYLDILSLWLLPLGLLAPVASIRAQDLLNDNPTYSPFNLELRPYAKLPVNDGRIIGITTRSGDARLYVTTEGGTIYTLHTDAEGNTTPVPWFDVRSAQISLGHPLFGTNSQMGLQSVTFHPEFEHAGIPGYGKLYTTMLEQRPASSDGHFYLGDSTQGVGFAADGVLAEWTFNHLTGLVDTNSYRELFRVNMPLLDHPIKQARFNPYAKPGDEDYGLLYLTHGDSNLKESPNDDPQHLSNVLGKMLRINPLPSGSERYTIPASNPFAANNDAGVLKEIYAYGLRNPHTFSFNRDDSGNTSILVGDIGRNNIEEINLIVPGGNFGWPEREGTFVHLQLPNSHPDAGYITDVAVLPANEATFGYMFPVAQYDHNAIASEINSGSAVASGFVIRNGSDPNLHNQLIFTDFSNSDGIVYHADFQEMLDAVAQLDVNDPLQDEPGELTQAVLHKLRLSLDDDNNPNTPSQLYDDFLSLLGASRTDTRFGEGVFGEMYISSKVNGTIYLVTNSLPLPGDYNRDRIVDAADYTAWRNSLGETGYHLAADGNGNGAVDAADYDVWRAHFGKATASGSGAINAAIPEPATMLLLMMAAAGVCSRRLRAAWRYQRAST